MAIFDRDYDDDRSSGYGRNYNDYDEGRFTTNPRYGSGSGVNRGYGSNRYYSGDRNTADWDRDDYGGYRGGSYSSDYNSRNSSTDYGYGSRSQGMGGALSPDRDRYYGERARSMGYGGGNDYDRYSASSSRDMNMNRGYSGSDVYDYGDNDEGNDDFYRSSSNAGGYDYENRGRYNRY